MFCQRIIFLCANKTLDEISKLDKNLLFIAFRKGFLFDSLIVSYILAIPVLIITIASFIGSKFTKKFVGFIKIYIAVLFCLAFSLGFIDIPYFKYNHEHISPTDFQYLKYFKTTAGMIFGEKQYLFFLILLFITCGLYIFLLDKIIRKTLINLFLPENKLKTVLFFLPIFGLIFLGMRGSLERYPLKLSNASFCTDNFLNKIPINATFYLMKNLEMQSKGFNSLSGTYDLNEAYKNVRKILNISDKNPYSISRNVTFDSILTKPNVILILCESLSSEYLKMKQKNGNPLMPFLHELIDKSYYFENFYSAGIHTNNGIFSSLYGFPVIFNRPSLQNKPDFYTGIPYYLKQNDYKNYFFITGNSNYDNMKGFLYNHGHFDKIYDLDDYPREKSVNNFGIQDDFLFEFGLKELHKFNKNNQPFFAIFLTVSNHPPYIIPEKYKNRESDDSKNIMLFSDDTLKNFIENSRKQKWASNTIFLILGDHGKTVGEENTPMPINYNHIPLIIYSEMFKDAPRRFINFGGQIDIFPTLMNLLKINYTNNTFGVDLFQEKRSEMYFVNNNQLGVANDSLIYIYNTETKSDGLYRYKTKNSENISKKYPQETQTLKNYGFSMTIVAEDQMLGNRKK